MRYVALTADYDGTLASKGRVDDAVVSALGRLRASGRQLILVTGRQLPDLLGLFPQVTLCDLVVAENGGVLYRPATGQQRLLAPPPPLALIAALRERQIAPLAVGQVVVGTVADQAPALLAVIHDLGLEHQVIFNKGQVMILPPNINKGSGLEIALEELRLSPHNVVAIGDAENDHALLGMAECGVAVANALPLLRDQADVVTHGAAGAGAVELIEMLLADDLAAIAPAPRPAIALGVYPDGELATIPSFGVNILIAGSSGSGKSTIMTGLIERLIDGRYQVCTIDPEGEYDSLVAAMVLGGCAQPPAVESVLRLLDQPNDNAVVNLLAIPLAKRPSFFARLSPSLATLRDRMGRPHWLAIDEAHHVIPAWADQTLAMAFPPLRNSILATVNPAHVDAAALTRIDVVIACGERSDETVRSFCQITGLPVPGEVPQSLPLGKAFMWQRSDTSRPFIADVIPPRSPHHRHLRKYAQGELDGRRSFYFRGPRGDAHERASNLMQFADLIAHIDDDTWLFHLLRGDVARWFRRSSGTTSWLPRPTGRRHCSTRRSPRAGRSCGGRSGSGTRSRSKRAFQAPKHGILRRVAHETLARCH